jgi:hypothetical protein
MVLLASKNDGTEDQAKGELKLRMQVCFNEVNSLPDENFGSRQTLKILGQVMKVN